MRRRPLGLIPCMAALAAAPPARPEVFTVRLSTGRVATETEDGLPQAWVAPARAAPRIDGRLDEETWSGTRGILLGGLRTRGTARPRTEVRLARGQGFLYAGIRLAEPNVGAMKRAVAEPDGPAYRDDSVELFLSPFPARGYFQLIIGATGAIYDRVGHGDPAAFDAGARAAVAIGRDHWSVEVAIPMAALGAGEAVPDRWRANFYRNRRAGGREEHQAWSPTLRDDYDVPGRFGHLLLTPSPPWAERARAARRERGIEIARHGDVALLRFDPSRIPKGARVWRARLRCERRPVDPADPEPPGPIEIHPLRAPFREGVEPAIDPEPLRLAPPWYRSFDVTHLVDAWVRGGRPNHGLLVARFPGWRPEETRLDAMVEGRPDEVPPQASGLRVFHRAGQTFITWREIEDPVGRDAIRWGELEAILETLRSGREIRYCIYRGREAITRQNLHEAEKIAAVPPLSCWNVRGRTIARAIDAFIATAKVLRWHQWNPFRDARVDGDYGLDCPIDRLVIAEGEGPLPRGTGLYVHTAARDERAYYAVLASIDGIENTVDLGPGNALTRPIEERVAEPEPVLQGEVPPMPFFHYRQHRLHYVRWVGPPYTNRPCESFNWSAGIPEPLGRGVPLELNLHRDGYGYWRTHYRIEPGSIVLCPHDFPVKTWWYGYHEALGTLRPWKEGVVRPYTERRLLSFIDWAARKWPVDRDRILVTGTNGGASGSGALHLGLRHPEVFNMVIAGHGEAAYTGIGAEVERIWGRVAWGLRAETGRTIWDELDLVRAVGDLPPAIDLPFVSMTYARRQASADALARALMAAGRPVITHTAWGGERLVPVSATATFRCVRLAIRKDRPLLAVEGSGDVRDRVRNASLLWDPDDIIDEPDTFAITVRQTAGTFRGSITPRRLRRFGLRRGAVHAWELAPLRAAAGRGRGPAGSRAGTVRVGGDGLLRIRDMTIPQGTYRLTIRPHEEGSR